MSDDAQRTPRSLEEAKMMHDKEVSALKAARERGLRGKAFADFAESIGVMRSAAYKMIRHDPDHPDRGLGAKEH
jgi:hypothetical protein